MSLKQYAVPKIYLNSKELLQCSAFCVTENEIEHSISITSLIPEDGLEVDPEINTEHEIMIALLGKPIKQEIIVEGRYCGTTPGAPSPVKVDDYKVTLVEKKLSASVDKITRQILLFKIV